MMLKRPKKGAKKQKPTPQPLRAQSDDEDYGADSDTESSPVCDIVQLLGTHSFMWYARLIEEFLKRSLQD